MTFKCSNFADSIAREPYGYGKIAKIRYAESSVDRLLNMYGQYLPIGSYPLVPPQEKLLRKYLLRNIELLPPDTLPKFEYKAKLVRKLYEGE